MQELVVGRNLSYWSLVQAPRRIVGTRDSGRSVSEGLRSAGSPVRMGLAHQGDVAQPKLAYANFRANLIAAQANVIQREAALRNMIGLPPEDGQRMVP